MKSCSNKVSLWNGKIDYIVKICKNPTNIRVELKQVSLNDSTSLTFPSATYLPTMEKREYKIELSNIGQLTRKSLEGISKALNLYLDCFNNPFSSGCLPPTKGCFVENSSSNKSMMQIVLEQDNTIMHLTCVQGSFGTHQQNPHPPKQGRSKRSGDLFPCCPKDKNIICHGCRSIVSGGKVKVTVCPKGFKCLGQVSGGKGGNAYSNTSGNTKKKTSLTIVHHAKKLLYRQRRPTESNNTVEDLINLDHLKIVHKALEMLTNDITNL
jgi:hypothetical protein